MEGGGNPIYFLVMPSFKKRSDNWLIRYYPYNLLDYEIYPSSGIVDAVEICPILVIEYAVPICTKKKLHIFKN